MSKAIIHPGQGGQKTNHGQWSSSAQLGGMAETAARTTAGAFKPKNGAPKTVYKQKPEELEKKGPVVPSGEEKPAQEQDSAKVEERRKPPNCSIFETA